MMIIAHRVNERTRLKEIPSEYGVELDVRDFGDKLLLGHEPFVKEAREELREYLKNFKHAIAVLDIKSEFIEKRVIEEAENSGLKKFFLLGVTFPAMWALEKAGEKRFAVRFSEDECIETCLLWKARADWVWVDTKTKNPLTPEAFKKLKTAGFKICLVSPCRWGRPQDIDSLVAYFKKNEMNIDAVMTELKHAAKWRELDK